MVSVMVIGCGNNQGKPADEPASKGSSSEAVVPGSGSEAVGPAGYTWIYTDQGGMQEDAKEAFDKAFETYTASSVFEPIALLGTQVVAGTNYAILMKETPSENPDGTVLKVVTIYKDLQGNCSISGFVPLDLNEQFAKAVDKTADDQTGSEGGEMLAGGWTAQLGGPELSKEAAEFFSAYEALEDQKMMVYIGSGTADGETVYAALKTIQLPEDSMQTQPLMI